MATRTTLLRVFFTEVYNLPGALSRSVTRANRTYSQVFERVIAEGVQTGRFSYLLLGMCNWIQFHSDLCGRYRAIRGVRIGRGFSKRILTEPGDSPGAAEHLFLAIEMARIGQQVLQVPPALKTRLAESQNAGPSLAAYNAWSTDRAYMPELANSCYTYRDASAALFAGRAVRMGFSADLYSPRPGEKRVFWREKRLCISVKRDSEGNDFYACQNSMNDTVHDIMIGFDLARDGMISNAHSRGLRLPYLGICEDAQGSTARLNGLRVSTEYVLRFSDRVGGSEGCAHLFDLSIDLLRLFRF